MNIYTASMHDSVSNDVISSIDNATSVPERFQNALAQAWLKSGDDLALIKEAGNNPGVATNPEALHRLQSQLEDYSKRMTVTAGLANHAVKTFETLLKS